jgi:hypothetical protein
MPLPFAAPTLLKQLSPWKAFQPSFIAANWYAVLPREGSPAPAPVPEPAPVKNLSQPVNVGQERGRSISFKRKLSDGNSYAAIAAGLEIPRRDGAIAEDNIVWVMEANVKIAKVESLCDKIVMEASQQSMDPALVPIFGIIAKTLKGVSAVQKVIVQKVSGEPQHVEPQKSIYFGLC